MKKFGNFIKNLFFICSWILFLGFVFRVINVGIDNFSKLDGSLYGLNWVIWLLIIEIPFSLWLTFHDNKSQTVKKSQLINNLEKTDEEVLRDLRKTKREYIKIIAKPTDSTQLWQSNSLVIHTCR